MKHPIAKRIVHSKRSFIREILKDLERESMISFSGGFPNPSTFPVDILAKLSDEIYAREGSRILQYSSTEGYPPLREWIAQRYFKRHNLIVHPDEILITNGSQQAFDLIAKVFINPEDGILIEKPSYLGALQSFTLFEPRFHSAHLKPTGIDLDEVDEILSKHPIKLAYSVPNFQNPSGLSYDLATRQGLAERLLKHGVLLVEDDPYGELRFEGQDHPPIKKWMGEDAILLGSFSKIVSPGLRIGWVVASLDIIEKLIIAKEAADLQANLYSQMLIHAFVTHTNLDDHIASIQARYARQRTIMLESMQAYFPQTVQYVVPEGGMFFWVTLPAPLTAMQLFEEAKKRRVVFVPGDPFYVDEEQVATLRLNFTNSEPEEIKEGIKRLADAIESILM